MIIYVVLIIQSSVFFFNYFNLHAIKCIPLLQHRCNNKRYAQTDAPVLCCCWLPGAEDLAVSTRKATEEAAQVGAGPEWEGQRKEESEESVKPG